MKRVRAGQKRIKRITKTAVLLAAVFLAVLTLGGCGMREAFSSGQRTEKEYGIGETMVIATTERLRYETLYSDQIWNAAVDNRGTIFEAVLIEQIHDFLHELRVMSLMAEDENIELSSREKELAREAAGQYYETLGGTDAARLGISERDLEEFYTDYWRAEKLVDKLTAGVNLEVSDSEAKVITVLQIETDTEEAAKEALARVRTEGVDFSSAARDYAGDGEIRRQIWRGQHGSEYEEAAYALTVGEISGVLEDAGRYYILKCVSDYDEVATRLHKEQMVRRKKNDAFYGTYQTYKDQIELIEDPEIWKDFSVSQSPKVTADFFGIFEQVCRSQE